MNRRTAGAHYEDIAADYLKKQGFVIIARNFRCRAAEIDLISREGKYLVFTEVKMRSSRSRGMGSEAVDRQKQYRICQAAVFYMHRYRTDPCTPVRFDVISIDSDRIKLIRNAFPFQGRS